MAIASQRRPSPPARVRGFRPPASSPASRWSASGDGCLRIAATHSQARYALPPAVRDFRSHYPRVKLHMHQGTPQQVAQMLLRGEADVGVATEALADFDGLVTLPCYRWTHSIVVPPGHPLLDLEVVDLAALAAHPIITYEHGYTGRAHIDAALTVGKFGRAGSVYNLISGHRTFGLANDEAAAEIDRMVEAVKNWKQFFARRGVEQRSIDMLGQAILPESFFRTEPPDAV